MYAVVKTGGKQTRVAEGERVQVEHLGAAVGDEITLTPVLVVDGDVVLSTPDELAGASVAGRVVGEAKGPKITGFTYKHKTRSRRRWGHRQGYDVVEITGINAGDSSKSTSTSKA
ncbi:MAG: large subunit ribosomal protein [Acidimicrobiaceae bacterium]|jgi:large subunit ribosomal protein L21